MDEPTYIVAATQPDGSKVWTPIDTLEHAFMQASQWRSASMREITVAQVIPYEATIHITSGGQTYDLPVPDVE